MTIAANQIKYFKTTNGLGGNKLSTELTSALLNDVFSQTSSAEADAGKREYACFYVQNTNGTDTATAVKQWLVANTPSESTVDTIGLGSSGAGGDEPAIPNKNTAPTGVVFSLAANEVGCLNLPDLGPNQFHAIWIKRVTSAGAAGINIDNSIIRTKVDTPA